MSQAPEIPTQAGAGNLASRFGSLSTGKKIAAGCGGLVALCVVCSLIGAVANSMGGISPTSVATATPAVPGATPEPTKAKEWTTIQHFSGTQKHQTDTFHVPDSSRLSWTAKPVGQYGGSFSITSYNKDGVYGDLIANAGVSKDESGTYTFHGDADIYLDIDALFVSYDVTIQALQ